LGYRAKDVPSAEQIEVRGGLRVRSLPAALPVTSGLNRELLAGGHSTVAGRLAGALRAIGRPEFADDVLDSMRAAGYTVQKANPFLYTLPILRSATLLVHLPWWGVATTPGAVESGPLGRVRVPLQ